MNTLADLFCNAIKDFNFNYDRTLSAWLISGEIKDINRVNNIDTIRFLDSSALTVEHIDGEPVPALTEDCNDDN